MKVLITTDLFTTATNGVVTSLTNLWEELKAKGHEVKILTFSENHHSHQDGDVYYIRSMPCEVYPNMRMPLSYRHRLINELIEWKPDVVHSQCEFFSYQFAQRIARLTGAPLIHTYHTLYEQYVTYVIPSRRLGIRAVRMMSRNRLKRADRVIVPSHKAEDALKTYGMKNEVCVVPSGISLEQHRLRLASNERLEKRRMMGIADDETVLINLGRLGTEKNLAEVVQYFAKAAKAMPDVRLMIVGDGPAKEELELLSDELGLQSRVIFTGMVPPTEVHEYYQLADVFVNASTSETQGLTYVEAAANALPLLCRRDRCLVGVLEEGANGYEYTNEEDYLAALRKIVGDREWRVRAAKRSEEIAMQFDKKSFADKVVSLYLAVLREERNMK